MDGINLLTPILDTELRHVNYFNGRLLTAEEMAVEQEANALAHRLLGQAAGGGIVGGLRVTRSGNQKVAVGPGLAVAPDGRLLRLKEGQLVSLVADPSASGEAATGAGQTGFRACQAVGGATPVNTGNGAYLLLLAPAYGEQGSAVTHRLGGNGIGQSCSYAYDVDGVKFRLVRIERSLMESTLRALHDTFTAPGSGLFQNALAHFCLGTKTLLDAAADPFARSGGQSAYLRYGLMDRLLEVGSVYPCEVPLAVIGWSAAAIAFVDLWSVRRPLIIAGVDDRWPFHTRLRRLAEGQAAFLQFQEQLEKLEAASANPGNVRAADHFRYLPAAGYLPVGDGDFNVATFFGRALTVQDIDPIFINAHLQNSWRLLPLDLKEAELPLNVFSHAENDDVVFFMRGERTYEVKDVVEPPAEEPAEPVGQGSFQVELKAGRTLVEAGKTLTHSQVEALIRGLVVEAVAGRKSYPGKRVSAPTYRETGWGRGDQLGYLESTWSRYGDKASALYYTISVPPGEYTVQVSGDGLITQKKSSSVRGGEKKNISFTLEAKIRDKKPPSKGIIIPDDAKYGKGYIVPDVVVEELPKGAGGWVVDPPPEKEVVDWLIRWGEKIQDKYPDEVINPADPILYVDPAYDAKSTPVEPYAFVEYGRGGAAVPVVLTGLDHTLERPASVLKGDIAGLDAEVALKLNEAGIVALDMLAAMPAAYTADALGIGSEAALSLGQAARGETENLKDSLRLLGGVDAATETTVRGILDVAEDQSPLNAMANANVDALVEGGLDRGFALRLVDEARAAVPAANWSLADPRLGLSGDDRAALGSLGIKTQGQLLARENLRDEMTNLGASAGFVDRVDGAVGVARVTDQGGRRLDTLTIDRVDDSGAATPAAVTDVVGGEFRNAGEILAADRETLVSAAGGDEATADRVASAAMRRVLDVDESTADALVAGGFNNAAAIADADPDAIANVVGSDRVRNVFNAANALRRSGGTERLGTTRLP